MIVKTRADHIVSNIDPSMTIENIPLTNEDKTRIKEYLEEKISYEEAYNQILKNMIY